MKTWAVVGFIGLVLCVSAVHAADGSRNHGTRTAPAPPLPGSPAVRNPESIPALRVRNVRLEPPPPDAPRPSSILKFELMNESGSAVTDVLLEIAIAAKERSRDAASQSHPIVRPFQIRGHATIDAGYAVDYEMLLRNVTLDCACVPNVTIVSARPLTDR